MAEIDDKLLAEILADPDDDRPRLVLADVLTHRGDARGEFIALQCRIASQPADPAVAEWTARSDQLLAENQADPRPDKRWLAVPASRVTWRRGFPELVHARQEDILDAPSIPGLLTLELGNCQNARTLRMAGAGILRHIRKLHLSTAVSTDPLASGGLAALAEVPFRLVELGMVSRVGPAGIEAFNTREIRRSVATTVFTVLGTMMLLWGGIELGFLDRVTRRVSPATRAFVSQTTTKAALLGLMVGAFLIGRPFPVMRDFLTYAAASNSPIYGAAVMVVVGLGQIALMVLLFLAVVYGAGAHLSRWVSARPDRAALMSGLPLLAGGSFFVFYWGLAFAYGIGRWGFRLGWYS